jgi:hypothetical protein
MTVWMTKTREAERVTAQRTFIAGSREFHHSIIRLVLCFVSAKI